jgi:hypothetical protein
MPWKPVLDKLGLLALVIGKTASLGYSSHIYVWIGLDMATIECGLSAITGFSSGLSASACLRTVLHRCVPVSWHKPLLLGVGELHDQVLAISRGCICARSSFRVRHSQFSSKHGSMVTTVAVNGRSSPSPGQSWSSQASLRALKFPN